MHLPGISISSVSGCLLKGSVLLFNKCRIITDRSMIWPLGNNTGSVINVSIKGSLNSSGASSSHSSDLKYNELYRSSGREKNGLTHLWFRSNTLKAFSANSQNCFTSPAFFIPIRSIRAVASLNSCLLKDLCKHQFIFRKT